MNKQHARRTSAMNAANDSVILCDTPSPAKPIRRMDAKVMDYKNRLRSSSAKNLLSTVYESPLMHFKRNKISEADKAIEINDVTIVHSPPAKKRKKTVEPAKNVESEARTNLEESVIIVNDATPEPPKKPSSVVEVGYSDTETNDVIEVLEASDLPEPTIGASPSDAKTNDEAVKQFRVKLFQRKKKKGKKRILNLKNAENLKVARNVVDALNGNDENHNGQIMERNENECLPATSSETEDVEVVWVSGPEATSQGAPSADVPFVVDTMPSLTTLVNGMTVKASKKQKRLNRTNNVGKKRGRVVAADSDSVRQTEGQNNLQSRKLREIVIDGPNVGMGHTCGKGFSEKGLKIVIDYFKRRGHVVKAFLPQKMRTRERVILEQLHKEGTVVFTPSRRIGGKTITPYDDRYILEYATQCGGIVVSSDQYRDLWFEKPQWRKTIEKRLLTPTFAGDYLMFPEDPLGRSGPKLDEFLRH